MKNYQLSKNITESNSKQLAADFCITSEQPIKVDLRIIDLANSDPCFAPPENFKQGLINNICGANLQNADQLAANRLKEILESNKAIR